MNRRHFIAGLAGTAGWGITGGFFRGRADSKSSVLAIASGGSPADLVHRALKSLGGIRRFVSPGKRVVVKPNIGWDRTPEQAANTHPAVVAELVKEILAAGAREVKVFDRTCNDPRRCYQRSGILPALNALNDDRVICTHMDDRKYVRRKISGNALDSWEFYRDALDADVYINVPVAKHHSLAGLSLGIKNVMGVLGGNRGRLHHGLGRKLAEISTVLKPHLTIIDATRMLLRNGPQGGNLNDVKIAGKLVISPDVVAADAYATTLFAKAPDALETTRAAAAMGLGEMNLDNVRILTA